MSDFKTPSQSLITMNQLVLPNDTNHLDNLYGGRLMYWMDIVAALCAMKHSNQNCVTASVDNLTFKNVIPKGSNAYLEAKVTRVFNSSLEVQVKVLRENFLTQEILHSNDAYFMMVAIDAHTQKPIPVIPVKPETAEEQEQYDMALVRRQLRLFHAKKINLSVEELHRLINQS